MEAVGLQHLSPDCWAQLLSHLTQKDRFHLLTVSRHVHNALAASPWPSIRVTCALLNAQEHSPGQATGALAHLRASLQRHRPSEVTLAGFITGERLRLVLQAAGTGASAGEGSRGESSAAAAVAALHLVSPLPSPRLSAQPWTSTLASLSLSTNLLGLEALAQASLPRLQSLRLCFTEMTTCLYAMPDLSATCPSLESLTLRWEDGIVVVLCDVSALAALGPTLRSLTLSAVPGSDAHVQKLGATLAGLPHLTELQLLDVDIDDFREPTVPPSAAPGLHLLDRLPEGLEYLALSPPAPANTPRFSVMPRLARLPRLRRLALHWWFVDEAGQNPALWDDGEVKARLATPLPALEELSVILEGGGTLFLGCRGLAACPRLKRVTVEMCDRDPPVHQFGAYAHLVIDGNIASFGNLLRRTDLCFVLPAAHLHMLPPAMFSPDVVEGLELHGTWERCGPTPLGLARFADPGAQHCVCCLWGFEAGWHRFLIHEPNLGSWKRLRGGDGSPEAGREARGHR